MGNTMWVILVDEIKNGMRDKSMFVLAACGIAFLVGFGSIFYNMTKISYGDIPEMAIPMSHEHLKNNLYWVLRETFNVGMLLLYTMSALATAVVFRKHMNGENLYPQLLKRTLESVY